MDEPRKDTHDGDMMADPKMAGDHEEMMEDHEEMKADPPSMGSGIEETMTDET